jgi:hypothetical protein
MLFENFSEVRRELRDLHSENWLRSGEIAGSREYSLVPF